MTYLTLRKPVVNPFRLFSPPFIGYQTAPVGDAYKWYPSTDISETDDSYEVRAELPGVPMEDVHISVKDGLLTIKGEKRQENAGDTNNYRRVERRYGSFERSFSLPPKVDADNIKAEFNDGVLTLAIPKPDEVKPKEIPITVHAEVSATQEN